MMRDLRSVAGVLVLAKYVSNWYSVLAVYFKIISKTKARFRNGIGVPVSEEEVHGGGAFHEELFKQYLQDKGFTYSTTGDKKIVRVPCGLQISYTVKPSAFYQGSSFLHEIFVAKVYGDNNLDGQVVIDGGTFVGDSSLYFISRGASKVYGFEIDTEDYNLTQENARLNNMQDKIHVFNQKCTYESVKNLIVQYGLKNIFLKLDCDGCEYDVIMNAETKIFENISDIVVECHEEYEPLMRKIRELGFSARRKKKSRWDVKLSPSMIYCSRKIA
jgi:16S rRNA G966 N2-methylase RsmD